MSEDRNVKLPKKTCTIEKLVTIPADVEKVLSGKKTQTRRNGRYADIGETMWLDEQEFVVHSIYKQKLGELSDEDAKQEGYANLEDYKNAILSIHPNMPWVPQMQVCVHEYKRVNE
ncbi:ASCH domain-containing protein [Ornithinibacillus gellani]|uniref:ASCH domain-containing protein n=1 Tax=Ornithinibacillus gellani TaxID=2293253 RepID=UPI000F46D869|nr:ASCH domain-containing protein [Ornithinibacillus gellani]TQS75757.1 ASCH domain-containing protein [Ornithinibacillus gellani]